MTHRTYSVRSDILPEYQTCCEQRDLLNQSIEDMAKAPHNGILTSSASGDIVVSGILGGAMVLILRGIIVH